MQIVDGGYENFMIMYPMMTTNPNYERQITNDLYIDIVTDIEYPVITDIKMKNDTISEGSPYKSQTRPTFDRKTKPIAMQHYDEKKPLDSIFKEKEQLTEKALEKAKQALKVENDLKEIMKKDQDLINETQKKEWYDKQQELSFKLMQFENERDDNVSNIDALLTCRPIILMYRFFFSIRLRIERSLNKNWLLGT